MESSWSFLTTNCYTQVDWKDEAHMTMDDRVATLLDDEADLMLQRFSSGVYWSEGKFESRTPLA